ncbi:MAG: VWA domain-containing protein [Methylophaga sp.]|nr:VWA domain-containing protein [Methylophaga sp.]
MLLDFHWAQAYLLWLLPLVLLPWFNHNQDKTVAWVDFIPADPISKFIGLALKLLASIVLLSLILALAGPYLPEKKVERVAEGAEIVLLFDRSRSMDDAFAVKGQATMRTVARKDSKRRVAKSFLTEFVKKRPDDRFGFVLFSSDAIDLLPLTYSKEAILATINASALGKGLSETNMAKALIKAADMYQGQVYRGSRIVMLVSDGGQELDEEQQIKIKALYQDLNITLYWIYMRSMQGMTLDEADDDNLLWLDTPERKLHTFFNDIKTPYRAFEVESVKTFSEALDEIDKQHYQTLIVEETLPREPKERPFYWLALFAILLLALAQLYTVWGVRKAHE